MTKHIYNATSVTFLSAHPGLSRGTHSTTGALRTPGCFLWMDDVVLIHTDRQIIQKNCTTIQNPIWHRKEQSPPHWSTLPSAKQILPGPSNSSSTFKFLLDDYCYAWGVIRYFTIINRNDFMMLKCYCV